MDYTDIELRSEDGIAVITLSRPEQRNAFSGAMGEQLGHAYRRCDADDDVRVVVLTGAGTAFCVGADLAAGAETFGAPDRDDFSASPVSPPAWAVRKPVIAALNGHAVGLGLTLALQCDLRIAASEGRYGVLQVRRGVMPDAAAHYTLPRIVGMERAAYLLLTGARISGDEAAAMGLVLRAVPAVEVLDEALVIAREIAEQTAPLSVAVTKRLLWQSPQLDAAQVAFMETELHHVLMGAPDAIEGPVAYLERRKPRWTSQVERDWPRWPEPPARSRS